MAGTILYVDDVQEELTAIARSLSSSFTVEMAASGEAALARLESGPPVAVLISDLNMPGMDGIQLLAAAKGRHPDTMRLLLTGNAGLAEAIQAINDGHLFRFLTKPCSPAVLRGAVDAALEQRRLVLAERELLEQTVRGVINTFSELLAMVNPVAFGRSLRIRRWVREMCSIGDTETDWSLDVAASLSQIGCISVSEQVLTAVERDLPVSPEEHRAFEKHPVVGSDLLGRIPRLEVVAEMIARQRDPFAQGLPATPGEAGGRVLRVAGDFDHLLQSGMSRERAFHELAQRQGRYDPEVLEKLRTALQGQSSRDREEVAVSDLRVGMVLAEDVISSTGVKLLREGFEITEVARVRLQLSAANGAIGDRLVVLIPDDGDFAQ